MSTGGTVVLALTAGALAGLVAILVATRNGLVDDGITLAVPVVGNVTIHPKIESDPKTLAAGAGAAVVVAIVAFVVARAV